MVEISHEITELTEEPIHDDHAHNNTVVIRGREITVEGGIYTVVFGALGILTIIEVLTAEVLTAEALGDGDGFVASLKAFLLLSMAIIKAAMVIWFYMHLRDDNRILAVVLLLPLLIASLSVMFVLSIPPTGYGL